MAGPAPRRPAEFGSGRCDLNPHNLMPDHGLTLTRNQEQKEAPPARPRARETGLRVSYGFTLGASEEPVLLLILYAQVNRPWGSGFVQFLVTPSCVITTFAVAD